jgi:hypothetical protein
MCTGTNEDTFVIGERESDEGEKVNFNSGQYVLSATPKSNAHMQKKILFLFFSLHISRASNGKQ